MPDSVVKVVLPWGNDVLLYTPGTTCRLKISVELGASVELNRSLMLEMLRGRASNASFVGAKMVLLEIERLLFWKSQIAYETLNPAPVALVVDPVSL